MVELSSTLIEILCRIAEKNGGKILGVAAHTAGRLKQALATNLAAYFEDSFRRCSQVNTAVRQKQTCSILLALRAHISRSLWIEGIGRATKNAHQRLEASNAVRIFLVLGSAGTGKTFLFRWLFLTLLESSGIRLPFYIELRAINNWGGTDLVAFLHEALVSRNARMSLDAFRAGMRDGEYILILDGLDEVQYERRPALSRQLVQLQTTFPGLIIVVSSRLDEGLESWVLCRRYYVLPMDNRQVLALIGKLPYRSDIRSKFRSAVSASLYDLHNSFLSNPLLITVMLLTYADMNDVPRKIHLFYEQAYEALFYRHDAWKETGFTRQHHCALSIDDFRRCLSAFCIASYRKSQFGFTTLAALNLIKRAAEFERIELHPESFLADLVESVCILQPDGLSYTFTHRSFQEYFAAVFISRDPPIQVSKLIEESRRQDEATTSR